jgi:hypothetical protein
MNRGTNGTIKIFLSMPEIRNDSLKNKTQIAIYIKDNTLKILT